MYVFKKANNPVIQKLGLDLTRHNRGAFYLDLSEENKVYREISLRIRDPEAIQRLGNMGNEKLMIVGHGLPAIGTDPPKIESYDPVSLFNFLIESGYKPENHTGVIDIKACCAGTNRPDITSTWDQKQYNGASFAEIFFQLLVPRGFTGIVSAPTSYAYTKTFDPASDLVIPNQHGNCHYQQVGLFMLWKHIQPILTDFRSNYPYPDEPWPEFITHCEMVSIECARQLREIDQLLETASPLETDLLSTYKNMISFIHEQLEKLKRMIREIMNNRRDTLNFNIAPLNSICQKLETTYINDLRTVYQLPQQQPGLGKYIIGPSGIPIIPEITRVQSQTFNRMFTNLKNPLI